MFISDALALMLNSSMCALWKAFWASFWNVLPGTGLPFLI